MRVEAVNHVCLVVRDRVAAEGFYIGVFGLQRHHVRPTWLVLNETSTLHLVEIPEATSDDTLYHEVQHFALQVVDLQAVLRRILEARLQPFQMDFEGNTRDVSDPEDPLGFGLGTVFVRDPDGNLVEFLQEGRGIFQIEMRPRIGDQARW